MEPKQAWKLARRLLYDVDYDPGIEHKNKWVYASQESEEHKKRFESWIKGKGIQENEDIWILNEFKSKESQKMKWGEFLKDWPEILDDDDIRVTNINFTWILEYKSQKVARFGRKYNKGTKK